MAGIIIIHSLFVVINYCFIIIVIKLWLQVVENQPPPLMSIIGSFLRCSRSEICELFAIYSALGHILAII